jgi:hypothetical protein
LPRRPERCGRRARSPVGARRVRPAVRGRSALPLRSVPVGVRPAAARCVTGSARAAEGSAWWPGRAPEQGVRPAAAGRVPAGRSRVPPRPRAGESRAGVAGCRPTARGDWREAAGMARGYRPRPRWPAPCRQPAAHRVRPAPPRTLPARPGTVGSASVPPGTHPRRWSALRAFDHRRAARRGCPARKRWPAPSLARARPLRPATRSRPAPRTDPRQGRCSADGPAGHGTSWTRPPVNRAPPPCRDLGRCDSPGMAAVTNRTGRSRRRESRAPLTRMRAARPEGRSGRAGVGWSVAEEREHLVPNGLGVDRTHRALQGVGAAGCVPATTDTMPQVVHVTIP